MRVNKALGSSHLQSNRGNGGCNRPELSFLFALSMNQRGTTSPQRKGMASMEAKPVRQLTEWPLLFRCLLRFKLWWLFKGTSTAYWPYSPRHTAVCLVKQRQYWFSKRSSLWIINDYIPVPPASSLRYIPKSLSRAIPCGVDKITRSGFRSWIVWAVLSMASCNTGEKTSSWEGPSVSAPWGKMKAPTNGIRGEPVY